MKKKEDIRKRFMDYIADYQERIRLWENVKVVTKKDGTPFKDFAKNFSGAKVVKPAYSFGDIELHVANYGQQINGHFVEDKINTRELVKYSKFTPDESRIHKEAFLEPYFYLTIPEVEQKIHNTIELYKSYIQGYYEQLELLDTTYDEVVRRVNDTMDYIRETAGSNTSLYYELRECIQNVGY